MRVYKRIPVILIGIILMAFVIVNGEKTVHAQVNYESNSCSLNRGLDIALVMDNSGSITTNDPANMRIDAAEQMIQALHPYDRMAVIQFDTKATNLQSLTNNRTLINNALKLLTPSGGTDLSTGMQEALDEFDRNGGNNHKIMIILSDGESINNSISLSLAAEAYSKQITIYTIGLGSSVNENVLTKIATTTGGQYFQAVSAANLTTVFEKIRLAVEDLREPKVHSNWTLTQDLHMTGDLVLQENMKMDLNGYDLTVDGDLVLLSCSELRAVSGVVTAGAIEQKAGSTINLNNSQLNTDKLKQDGIIRVNGDYGGTNTAEIIVGEFIQQISGFLDLKGNFLQIKNSFMQEGRVHVGGGLINVAGNVTQKGYFNVQGGKVFIDGNLIINGGPLVDDEFTQNKSLNVGGGLVQVGSADSMNLTSTKGNVTQTSGQLYVNHGSVRIFGDYTIKDGWLTMIKGSMDTTSDTYAEGDGDFVHVYKDFSMESKRNHSNRIYSHLGKPMNDQAHLTDGILQVDGNFRKMGDIEYHSAYSDRSQQYAKDYSRYNFTAAGRHKVLLTGKGKIDVAGSGFTFNILEVKGRIVDYTRTGPVRWNRLIEKDSSANANLKSLAINDIAVTGFNPNVLNYFKHVVPVSTMTNPLQRLKVEAVAEDSRNATVQVVGDVIGVDGTAQVKVLVTAHDGVTKKIYTVNVSVGPGSGGRVTSISLSQDGITFIKNGSLKFTPSKATIDYTIYPKNADNQRVNWSSTNNSVATVDAYGIVTPVDVGEATIIAETADGGFMDSVVVKVVLPYDLLEGIRTLEDLISDSDRYDKIMSLYDLNKIGIVVPGRYIQSVEFNSTGGLTIGTVITDTSVNKVEVKVNQQQLLAPGNTGKFIFTRANISIADRVEVIAYNATGDELERIVTSYPVNFNRSMVVPYGYYSILDLLQDPIFFNEILKLYALDQLKFTAR